MLESKSFIVQEASRSNEAMKYVLNEKFAAVVFNMQPEDLNGVQIFSTIKTIDSNLPVISVTDGNVTLSIVSSIIHESFKLFQRLVGYNEIVAAVREATQMKVNS